MKNLFLILILFFFASCDKNAKKNQQSVSKEPIKEIIFTKITDLEMFKDYESLGGGVIEKLGNEEFGIQHILQGEKNVIIFEKIFEQTDIIKYQLLDTIVIPKLTPNQTISYQLCRKDTVDNSEIIALVEMENKQYFDKVIKAWVADRHLKKIVPIETKGIDCFNEGYGAE